MEERALTDIFGYIGYAITIIVQINTLSTETPN